MAIIGLCILVQLAILVGLIEVFNRNSFWFLFFAYLISVVVALYIISEDKIPEFKLPWILVVLLLPGAGPIGYLIFGHLKISKKTKNRFKVIKKDMKPYFTTNEVGEELKTLDKDAYLQAKYIYNSTTMEAYKNTKTTYYKLGDYFFPDFMMELKKAEKFIFMEYFIISKGQMFDSILEVLEEKVKQGVDVYLMYDDIGSMMLLPSNFYKTMREKGLHCIPFNRFKPVMTSVFNNRDHRKITVIDGKVGFTGGLNLSDEYINIGSKYGHWKDSAVKLEGEGVLGLEKMFIMNWNGFSDEQIDCSKYLKKVNQAKEKTDLSLGFVIPFGDGPDPIYKDKVGKTIYLNMITQAEKYVYITTPYLICDYEILDQLKTAAKKGVDVRIITPHIPDKKVIFDLTRSNYKGLIEAGVRVFEYTPGFVHAKNFLADDKLMVCGTINLDYRSLVHHFECGVLEYNTTSIKDMKKDFHDTFLKCQEMNKRGSPLNIIQRGIVTLVKIFSPLL